MIPAPGIRRLGATPLPILVTVLVALDISLPAQLGPGSTYEPPYLNAILYTVFISVTSWAVAYISLRSYLRNGSTTMLLLGSGGLAWGSASLIGSWLPNITRVVNGGITIVNTGALCAGLLHIVSATLTSMRTTPQESHGQRWRVALGYGAVLVFTGILTMATLYGVVPPFYVPGVGQTTLRMVVLGSAAALFALSSLIFARIYSQSKSTTLFWYFMALALTSIGLAAVFFGRAPGDPISWTGRTAQFLGGAYFLKAVSTTF